MEETTQTAHWRAVYKNGSALEQLENSQEILYENIDTKNLKVFFLYGCFIDIGVDLEDGILFLNGNKVVIKDFSNLDSLYRLIYFVKESGVVGRKRHKTYCVGMQTTSNGKNLRLMVEVSNDKINIINKGGN